MFPEMQKPSQPRPISRVAIRIAESQRKPRHTVALSEARSPKNSIAAEVNPSRAENWLKILICYEDFTTGQRAMKLCANLIDELGDEFQFRSCFWKFSLLRLPKFKAMATQDAAEADVIIISRQDRGSLPLEVKSWIIEWPKWKPGKTIISLANGEKNQPDRELCEMARKSQCEFFNDESLASCDGDPGSTIAQKSPLELLHAGQILPLSSMPLRHCGINE